MSEKNTVNIKQALEQLFNKNKKLRKTVSAAKVKKAWFELMEKTVAPYTTEVKFTDGILTVRLKSAALREELNRGKHLIIKNINEHLQEDIIREIRFQ